jgi:hypothetical protein
VATRDLRRPKRRVGLGPTGAAGWVMGRTARPSQLPAMLAVQARRPRQVRIVKAWQSGTSADEASARAIAVAEVHAARRVGALGHRGWGCLSRVGRRGGV